MNCLNRDQIQAYIDGEIDPETRKQWEEHITSCSKCQATCQEARDEIKLLHETLAPLGDYPENIPQPAIPGRRHRIIKKRQLNLLWKVAALVILMLGIMVIISRNAAKKRLYTNIEKTTRELIEDQDLNEMWQKNQNIIIITNKKGEVIRSEIF